MAVRTCNVRLEAPQLDWMLHLVITNRPCHYMDASLVIESCEDPKLLLVEENSAWIKNLKKRSSKRTQCDSGFSGSKLWVWLCLAMSEVPRLSTAVFAKGIRALI